MTAIEREDLIRKEETERLAKMREEEEGAAAAAAASQGAAAGAPSPGANGKVNGTAETKMADGGADAMDVDQA